MQYDHSFTASYAHRMGAPGMLASMSPLLRLLGTLLLCIAVFSGTWAAYTANRSVLTDIPKTGGTFVEAVVGTPRFINPLLAVSQSDRDLASVVYAGLMTRNADDELVPAVAQSYEVSEDGKTYTFHLRDDVTFHDGAPLTADDVVYTVTQAANPAVRSPLLATWENVQVEAPDAHTVVFTLPEAYAPFIENTTLGILPKHIWEGLSAEEFSYSQFNTQPVGAGAYRVDRVVVDKSGIPSRYELLAFGQYVLGTPYITHLHFNIYDDRAAAGEAYLKGAVDALYGPPAANVADILAASVLFPSSVYTVPQLRTFAVFLNHNKQPLFIRDPVREALNATIPRDEIVRDVLHGYGESLEGPLPSFAHTSAENASTTEAAPDEDADAALQHARDILEKAGWKRGEDGVYTLENKEETVRLAFSLSTSDVPELADAAGRIATRWRELGAEVEVKVFSAGDLTQSVIRPRRYDALLFGMDIGHELDLYAFWHSSKRNDPGLNIAQFADIEADAALEKLRTAQDSETRSTQLTRFLDRVREERAALFVYAPSVPYLVRARVHNVHLHPIATPSERFDTIHEWYIETDHVWPFVRHFID